MTEQNTDVLEVARVIKPAISTGSLQKTYNTKKAIFRSYQIIWYIVGVVEVVLAFRLLFKLLGANASSGFTSFIYAISAPLAGPFAGILDTTASSSSIIEWSTLITMAVYAVIAYGIIALFQLVKPTNPAEVSQAVDNQ
ncbi:YggT family protein [Candidatus Microgenomates bacterium]|nr:YggT family protein [Candidatus Microgenomates bacterium]